VFFVLNFKYDKIWIYYKINLEQNMSGHNKWSKIKHKKAATDAAKSKIFSKYVKLIQAAVKEANGDVNAANVLAVVEKARKENMPKANIDKAIKKGQDKDAAAMEEFIYEGYGPAGVGMIIVCMSDNKNRTAQEIKHTFSKNGYSLGAPGSVSWGFTKNDDMDWVPNEGTEVELSESDEEKLESLIEKFEELDDVNDVYHNAA